MSNTNTNTPSKARMARDIRMTTDADTMTLITIRDTCRTGHILQAALAELARRGFGTLSS